MGAEIALAGSHLGDPSPVQFVEAHKGMGLEGGAVRVSGWVRYQGLTFLHEEVAASPPLVGVKAPHGMVGVHFGKDRLRCHREGGETVGPHEEHH